MSARSTISIGKNFHLFEKVNISDMPATEVYLELEEPPGFSLARDVAKHRTKATLAIPTDVMEKVAIAWTKKRYAQSGNDKQDSVEELSATGLATIVASLPSDVVDRLFMLEEGTAAKWRAILPEALEQAICDRYSRDGDAVIEKAKSLLDDVMKPIIAEITGSDISLESLIEQIPEKDIIVTRNGKRVAAVMSYQEYEKILESIRVLSRSGLE
ncbi:MAG: type II toxin-antitoxin system Phd/YefM family antitoxin [Thiogranum sp.]|nr:type II toxin-antitoxin system Phd/YefM family antitoxin [Thiogranum sp.]